MQPKYKVGDILKYTVDLPSYNSAFNLITAIKNGRYHYDVLNSKGDLMVKSHTTFYIEEKQMELATEYIVSKLFNQELQELIDG